MLVKALAKQSGCFFLNISSSAILSKWLGDASRQVYSPDAQVEGAIVKLCHPMFPVLFAVEDAVQGFELNILVVRSEPRLLESIMLF